MRFSTRARYALGMMVAIARLTDGQKPVSLKEVAAMTTISRRYLEQVVIALKGASLLRGISGRSGGYLLARPAKNIPVSDIIEAAIGPINIVECVLDKGYCSRSGRCECRWLYQKINRSITDVLEEVSLEDLVHDPILA